MIRKILLAVTALAVLAAAPPALLIGQGWLKFRALERSIVDKMDQYYLTVTSADREEYLLAEDEDFEVPYMASKLSVQAEPSRVFDREGRLIGKYVAERALYVRSLEDIPPSLRNALVAAEDGSFFEHAGVNYRAIARAMLVNLRTLRKKQGGSTLTQQLAKMMFTERKKTYSRKVFELFCAKRLESKFTKDQIIQMYLNFAYFGHGCFGVECASRFYFGKTTRDLELVESAMLAGLIASPNNYSPFRDPELARARHRTVLRRMAKLGTAPSAAVERFSREFWRSMERRLESPEASLWKMDVNKAPYFIEHVRRRLSTRFGRERVLRGGLKIHTTLDLPAQDAAKKALAAGLAAENSRYAVKNPTRPARIEGALAAVAPDDGAILALVGGSAFKYGNQLDRTASRRPIGSSVKPFVYAAAFETGSYAPADTIIDEVAGYRRGPGQYWRPRNYGNKYHGEVTLESALRKSLNTVSVKLLAKTDIDRLIRLLAEVSGAGRRNFPRNLTLALGSAGLSPLELAGSYSVFVNGGRPVRPYAISRITGRDGEEIWRHEDPARDLEPVLSTGTCRTVLEVLEGVLRPGGTAYGAARRTGFTLPAAGKTGTTDEYRDAWFAGVTPELSAAVRVGHDDMRISLGPGRGGGAVAAPIWMEFVKDVYRHRPTRDFKK